ncbi:hypothetical protein ACFT0E_38110, partial [Streptomyces sp. NPDC057052]
MVAPFGGPVTRAAAHAYARAVAAGDTWAHMGPARRAAGTGGTAAAVGHASRAAATAAWAESVRLHWSRDDREAALRAAEEGARAGTAEGRSALAFLRTRDGDVEGARAAHRQAAAHGDSAARRDPALLADAHDDRAAAEDAAARARPAAWAGSPRRGGRGGADGGAAA